jgi:hypothetical protein
VDVVNVVSVGGVGGVVGIVGIVGVVGVVWHLDPWIVWLSLLDHLLLIEENGGCCSYSTLAFHCHFRHRHRPFPYGRLFFACFFPCFVVPSMKQASLM